MNYKINYFLNCITTYLMLLTLSFLRQDVYIFKTKVLGNTIKQLFYSNLENIDITTLKSVKYKLPCAL